MDGVHDLGGREGFGPIPDKEDAQPFHAEWETRAFGMEQSSAGGTGWSIDWFRHCRELIVPTDYLTHLTSINGPRRSRRRWSMKGI